MQTVYDLKAQISSQKVSDDIQMGMDTNFDDSYPENSEDSEYDWNNDASSVFAQPPSPSHSYSSMPQSPTSFSTIDDQAFDGNQCFQPTNLMTYSEGEHINERGIVDWSRNCMQSSQWRSEQNPEIESANLVAFLEPNVSLTPTFTESHAPEELLSTDMEP